MKKFRCTFSEGRYKVGQLITEYEYNCLPQQFKGNFKETV